MTYKTLEDTLSTRGYDCTSVHGGLTYSEFAYKDKPYPLDKTDEVVKFFGFDTYHYTDKGDIKRVYDIAHIVNDRKFINHFRDYLLSTSDEDLYSSKDLHFDNYNGVVRSIDYVKQNIDELVKLIRVVNEIEGRVNEKQ